MAKRIASDLLALLVFLNTSLQPLLARDPCPIFSSDSAIMRLISFSKDDAHQRLETFIQQLGFTQKEAVSSNSAQVHLWSQPLHNPTDSQARIAYLKERLNDPTLQTEVIDITLRTTQTATVPRIKLRDIKFAPNLNGIVVLAGSVALLFTDAAGLGITLLVVVGVPTALQLLYYALRTPDPKIFISQVFETELRDLALRSNPGEWLHVGLSFSRELQPASQTLSAYQIHYKKDIHDLDYWYMGYPYRTKFVTRLREDLMETLDHHYGYGRSTLDVFFVRLKWQRMKVLVLVTHPEKN